MNALSNFNRKLVYGIVIVVIFGIMFPYTAWLAGEKKRAIWVRRPSDRSIPAAS